MISKDPLNSIKEARDPITGKKLVLYSRRAKRWTANPYIPKVRSGEEYRVENYYEAQKEDFKGWRLHHRLELTIDNLDALYMMDLVNFGMYYHRPYFELIWLRAGDHSRMHARNRTGEKNVMYGRTGDKHPMHGRTREDHPGWKGDKANVRTLYHRARDRFKRGEISIEEFKQYKDACKEYRRSRRDAK